MYPVFYAYSMQAAQLTDGLPERTFISFHYLAGGFTALT